MKAVLVLNCGSSSIKFAVITENDKSVVLEGLAERLTDEGAIITVKQNGEKHKYEVANADHEEALVKIVEIISNCISHEIIGVGHRVVHGGEQFTDSCVIDSEVLAGIKDCSRLAPLHNPANIDGINAAIKAYPHLKQVAVFDTAFHQTLPETAYLYAIPYHYYKDYGVRRYGFHGTSFRYIAQAIPEYNNGILPEKVIIAHLGNGASVCALHNGKSVHTSMGLTPLEGLVQGTRSGNIDPAIISFLAENTGKSEKSITDELWKKSGLLGLSQLTNDCREIEDGSAKGDAGCVRALNAFNARLIEIIGSYAATLNGVDAIVFTGGIGENSPIIRKAVIEKLSFLGFDVDVEANEKAFRGKDGNIATTNSKPVWVIPTNEEAMIASDTFSLI